MPGRELASAAVRLPMLGVADSLNVSATAAVLFYEALRQRRADYGLRLSGNSIRAGSASSDFSTNSSEVGLLNGSWHSGMWPATGAALCLARFACQLAGRLPLPQSTRTNVTSMFVP